MLKLKFNRIAAFFACLAVISSLFSAGSFCYAQNIELDESSETEFDLIDEESNAQVPLGAPEVDLQKENNTDQASESENTSQTEPILEPEENENEESEEPPASTDTTTLTISIYWIDGNNYYNLRPGAVTFLIQRKVYQNGFEPVDSDSGWEDVPYTPETAWMTTAVLSSGDGWADKTIYDMPYRDDTLAANQHYAYRAVEYIYHYGYGIPDELVSDMYEYRNYSVYSYEQDQTAGNIFHYKTRCANAIRIYSVPTGDSYNVILMRTMFIVSLAGAGLVCTIYRKNGRRVKNARSHS